MLNYDICAGTQSEEETRLGGASMIFYFAREGPI